MINNPANVIDLAIPLNRNMIKTYAKKNTLKLCSNGNEAEDNIETIEIQVKGIYISEMRIIFS